MRDTAHCFAAVASLLFSFLFLVPSLNAQSSWIPVGPDGGDARSFEAATDDPSHLYMGTTNSWVYESIDEGTS